MVKKDFWFSNRGLVIVGAITLLLQGTIGFIVKDLAGFNTFLSIFQFQTTFDQEFFNQTVIGWGDEGRKIFLRHYYVDYLYPASYTTFLFLCLRRFYGSRTLIVPALAYLFDVAENVSHSYMVSNLDLSNTSVFYLASVAAVLKWLSVATAIGLIAFGYLKRPATQSK